MPDVFYSIGTDAATDRKTGSPTITISSGVATFSVAQTGNIGVGDRITHAGGDGYCFITAKQSTTVWNVSNATGGNPTDVTTQSVTSIKREYSSLSAAEAGASDSNHLNTTDLATGNYRLHFPCYADGVMAYVIVDGYTTSSTYYIKFYSPNNTSTECNTNQRHSRVWDDSKVRTLITNQGACFQLDDQNVIIEGFQISVENTLTYRYGVRVNQGGCKVLNNIFRCQNATASDAGGIYVVSGGSTGIVVANNIIYDFLYSSTGNGISASGADDCCAIYNNTVYGCYNGIHCGYLDGIAKNNISLNNFHYDYSNSADWSDYSTNNVSSDATAPQEGDYFINKTVNFISVAGKDFRLADTDESASAFGTNLSTDPDGFYSFSTDCGGIARGDCWSLGACDIVKKIFYSIKVTTSSALYSGNASAADGYLTLASAAANNIGIGDEIQVGSNRYYIRKRVDTTHFRIQNSAANSGVPGYRGITFSLTSIAIYRAYSSLSAAEAGFVDSNHLNSSNMGTSRVIVNFCGYNDGDDTTNLTFAGNNPTSECYPFVYVPYLSTEVGVSQRHAGKFTASAYRFANGTGAGIQSTDDYLDIEGIVGYTVSSSGNYGSPIHLRQVYTAGANRFRISKCILKGNLSGTAGSLAGIYFGLSSNNIVAQVWDCIITDFVNGATSGIYGIRVYSGATNIEIYNCVIRNNYIGIRDGGSVVTTAKNCAVFDSTDDFNETFAAIDHCASDDGDGTNPVSPSGGSWSNEFTDYTNDDFTLKDGNCHNGGVDNPGSGLFLDDIIGVTRISTWDIGAFQYIASRVYNRQSFGQENGQEFGQE